MDECECSVDFVDKFNNNRVYPRLKSLLAKNYFRFFKVNFKKPCPFWPDDGACASTACAVQSCSAVKIGYQLQLEFQASDFVFFQENIPAQLLKGAQKQAENTSSLRFGPANNPKLLSTDADHQSCDTGDHDDQLGYLNTTLTKEMTADLALWKLHDDNQNSFCDIDDDQNQDSVFVDLLLNPERYTGYKGPSAQRIWKTIYEENCFK